MKFWSEKKSKKVKKYNRHYASRRSNHDEEAIMVRGKSLLIAESGFDGDKTFALAADAVVQAVDDCEEMLGRSFRKLLRLTSVERRG